MSSCKDSLRSSADSRISFFLSYNVCNFFDALRISEANELISYSTAVPITERGAQRSLSELWWVRGVIRRHPTFTKASHIACANSTKSLTAVAKVTAQASKIMGPF